MVRTHNLSEKEKELVQLLMEDCRSTGDIQEKLKRLFAGTIEQILEAEMEEHLGYEKHSVAGNNTGNSRNGYGKKTITSDYGECEIAVPRDRNGEFEPKIIAKRQTRTDEIEQKIMTMYAKGAWQKILCKRYSTKSRMALGKQGGIRRTSPWRHHSRECAAVCAPQA